MKKRLIGLGAIVVFVLGIGWVAPLVTRWTHPMPQGSPSSAPPALTFKGVDLVEYAAGAKLWDLNADHVEYDPDHEVSHLSGIRARFYEQGRVVSTATSPVAVFRSGSRDLRMRGGIEVDSQVANTHVTADEVVWQSRTQQLHASGSVMFQRGPSRVAGPELWGSRSLEQVRMGSPVTARLRLEAQGRE